VRCERHEQAFGTLPTRAFDALLNLFWIHTQALGRESIYSTGIVISVVARRLFAEGSPDCLLDGINQAMRFTKIGSCRLQEEQMLRRSVEALVRRRNRHGDRFPQSSRLGFAAPHQ
jgi:hypothetical protein